MVDTILPFEQKERGLRYLFLDLNSYFASVEQQERPELRNRPMAVAPVEAETTFVIAASYEAKAFGVRTGTQVSDARKMCPDIQIVQARPQIYVTYHKRVLEAVDTVLPVEQVCSIDEMRFRLLGEEREPVQALDLGRSLKKAIHRQVGDSMNCSIGIAPNPFLAKLATELEKPDGLVCVTDADLPGRLYSLKLTDFTGINRKMAARLNGAGIFTAKDLCSASRHELHLAFGSITGEKWWYMLRGHELTSETQEQKTLGHSHVLPPRLRHDQGCRDVLLRLLQKASARLRSSNLWAGGMVVYVSGFKKSWQTRMKLPPTQDTMTLNEHLLEVWPSRTYDSPRSVGVTFYDLHGPTEVTPSLFHDTVQRSELSHAVDKMNQKFGKNKIYLAGMEAAKDTASEKIAFKKTWLFSEGKGDNEV
jgi:DNA polymerase-4